MFVHNNINKDLVEHKLVYNSKQRIFVSIFRYFRVSNTVGCFGVGMAIKQPNLVCATYTGYILYGLKHEFIRSNSECPSESKTFSISQWSQCVCLNAAIIKLNRLVHLRI